MLYAECDIINEISFIMLFCEQRSHSVNVYVSHNDLNIKNMMNLFNIQDLVIYINWLRNIYNSHIRSQSIMIN